MAQMQAAATRRDLAVGLPASALAGVVIGTIGTFKHQYGVSVATGGGLPVGLVLSLLMVLAFLAALRVSFATRWYAAAAAVGVLGAVALLALPGSSGGSTVILMNVVGIVWAVACAVLAVVVVGWPRLALRTPSASDAGGILDTDQGDPVADTKDH